MLKNTLSSDPSSNVSGDTLRKAQALSNWQHSSFKYALKNSTLQVAHPPQLKNQALLPSDLHPQVNMHTGVIVHSLRTPNGPAVPDKSFKVVSREPWKYRT